ncbi:MAG TPA: hypothetical protein VLA36_11100 [Longimicrobiales bacterium]|nr:hypothetical protein [Longimicrobiales bacterium]
MSRKRVLQKDLPALLAELEERGATGLRRHPPHMDGKVLVTWREPGAPTHEGEITGEMTGFVPTFVFSVGFVALVIAVVVGLLLSRAP